ncbi:hypothetical protein LOK49_LG11G00769 [Camellia lanceoleosa]|uniref:Uncharacterized protein n=1 Tax=Camellia lanceoleosa TaxID=1840588 RepID=A0ACC0G2E8_9ERIC|nr:hypothetical protein LOK49_LG11G00769 [Camellia lanceoleosa]
MWREIRLLAASKLVIASMADVAASGGYYMAMAVGVIVAEDLTLTGSIGVVTGEPSNSHSYGFFDIVLVNTINGRVDPLMMKAVAVIVENGERKGRHGASIHYEKKRGER